MIGYHRLSEDGRGDLEKLALVLVVTTREGSHGDNNGLEHQTQAVGVLQ